MKNNLFSDEEIKKIKELIEECSKGCTLSLEYKTTFEEQIKQIKKEK